nr:multiple inositol polyphosphate phosphatase 1-like [Onthophagus taurus]XP_022917215.1 multiple inositol polyphosphate phosphatase 1-like [Onthophagus taurus]
MLLLWIIFLNFYLSIHSEEYIENYLGTKSAYRYVANLNNFENHDQEGCATKIWMFVRHGTRYPGISDIKVMREHLPKLQDEIIRVNEDESLKIDHRLSKSDLLLFKKWYPRVEEYEAKMLTVEGEKEMVELAERMQWRFPNLLKPFYSNTSYVFKHTKTQRTKESGKYFATGLFGKSVHGGGYYPIAVKRNSILRFYKLCKKWIISVKKNAQTYSERNNFYDTEIMREALDKVSSKLGLDKLTVSDLHSMYVTCAFESSWSNRRRSPWCIPFDIETIKVLEYAEDLKYYWVDGYGYDLTCNQACPAFNDMFNFINSEEKYPNALFYFTHSGSLLKMLCHLGIYRDHNQLLANNFEENKNRQWKVSKIDPFGNNLAFILYTCNGTKKVLTMHNENIIRLPACPKSDFCDVKTIEDYYKNSLTCGFDEMCENNLINITSS